MSVAGAYCKQMQNIWEKSIHGVDGSGNGTGKRDNQTVLDKARNAPG